MKTYIDLFIKGTSTQLESFQEQLPNYLQSGWEHITDRRFIDDTIELQYNGDELPKASLFIYTAKKTGGKYSVSNIVPKIKNQLSINEYNSILMHCYTHCIIPCSEIVGVTLEKTSSEVSLENYMSEKSALKLRRFSVAANKSTGSGHPLDAERWNDFICQCYKDSHEKVLSILSRWLVEDENWSEDMSTKLEIEFERGIALLKYYSEKFND